MKHKTPEVTDTLLARAREEFLQYGYQDASLRRIASVSGVSTTSIYGRFGDKAGLFDALVKDAADELYERIRLQCEASLQETEIDAKADLECDTTEDFVDYIYDHFEAFQLIFCKSTGTVYEDYIDRLAALEEKVYGFTDCGDTESSETTSIHPFFVHCVTVSGYRYLYEMVAHELSREEAHLFMEQMTVFRMAGWKAILKEE